MSHTTLATAYEDGELEGEYEFRNSHGSAPFIWDTLCRKYEIGADDFGRWPTPYGPNMEDWPKLWSYHNNGGKLTAWEKNCLVTTYDNAVIKRDDMLTVAKSFEIFHDAFYNGKRVSSLAKQAESIRDAYEKGARFLAWTQTSVCEDWFRTYNEDEDDVSLYNVNKGTKHHIGEVLPLEQV